MSPPARVPPPNQVPTAPAPASSWCGETWRGSSSAATASPPDPRTSSSPPGPAMPSWYGVGGHVGHPSVSPGVPPSPPHRAGCHPSAVPTAGTHKGIFVPGLAPAPARAVAKVGVAAPGGRCVPPPSPRLRGVRASALPRSAPLRPGSCRAVPWPRDVPCPTRPPRRPAVPIPTPSRPLAVPCPHHPVPSLSPCPRPPVPTVVPMTSLAPRCPHTHDLPSHRCPHAHDLPNPIPCPCPRRPVPTLSPRPLHPAPSLSPRPPHPVPMLSPSLL